MGGTLVYNSYAQLSGCKKIEEYWADRNLKKVQTDILFSKNECKEVNKELFGEKARERDFMTENDKQYFKNLPRFQTQRDYSNIKNNTLPIPQ
jgi:hypothetical protein